MTLFCSPVDVLQRGPIATAECVCTDDLERTASCLQRSSLENRTTSFCSYPLVCASEPVPGLRVCVVVCVRATHPHELDVRSPYLTTVLSTSLSLVFCYHTHSLGFAYVCASDIFKGPFHLPMKSRVKASNTHTHTHTHTLPMGSSNSWSL